MARLQEQLGSGQRLVRPSDGPVDMVAVLRNRAEEVRLDTNVANILQVSSTLELSVSALREANGILTQASQLGLEGINSSHDENSTNAMDAELDALLGRLVEVANSQQGGQYLFSGTATKTTPFVVESVNSRGRPQRVEYRGAAQAADAIVTRQQTVKTFLPGDRAFQPVERQETLYLGEIGAAAGIGTDSATGQGTLLVRHTSTIYELGSGVQPAASSADGDTILGPLGSHRLTVNDTSGTGASGTVSLNGGLAVDFTSSDDNLRVTGPRGDIVFVDMTSISPGFQGEVSISAAGTLSLDNGLTEVAVDFSSNQVIADGTSGAVTNVDSTNIRQTGTELLDYAGTLDAFGVLIALRDDLRNAHGFTASQRPEAITRHLAELSRVSANIVGVIGEQSASAQNLTAVRQRIEDVQLELRRLTSDLEDADFAKLTLDLQTQENLFELNLAIASRIARLNLVNFLR